MLSSQSQALAHYKGTKHAKKLKALDAPRSKLKGSVVTKDTANQEITKGINTAQVPNGTERKGLCFPSLAAYSTHALLFSLCGCSSSARTQQTHLFGILHNMQSLRSWMTHFVDYINPVLAAWPMAGCRVTAQILNLWSWERSAGHRSQSDIRKSENENWLYWPNMCAYTRNLTLSS